MAERFLLDENVPASVIPLLNKRGFQVRTVYDALRAGSSNGQVADEASRAHEIIITLDSDFLKLHSDPKARIIIVDVHPAVPGAIRQVLEEHLDQCIKMLKSERRVRLTKTGPMPSG